MKRRELPSSFPLLGLLLWGPANGYQLHKRAEETLAHFWSEGFGQIYPTLELFLSRGWIRETEAGARKSRTFELTGAGHDRFRAWLAEPVESYSPRRHELLVKVFFAPEMAPGQLRSHLERYQALQRAYRERLGAVRSALLASATDPSRDFWLATLDHGLVLAEALDDWCERTGELDPTSRNT